MLSDFPTHPTQVKFRLYTDDVTIYADTKLSEEAEVQTPTSHQQDLQMVKKVEMKVPLGQIHCCSHRPILTNQEQTPYSLSTDTGSPRTQHTNWCMV